MVCYYENCPKNVIDACAKCGAEMCETHTHSCGPCGKPFCDAHRSMFQHACVSCHEDCGNPSTHVCEWCRYWFCDLHKRGAHMGCMPCSNNLAAGRYCSSPSSAECPKCLLRFCKAHLREHSYIERKVCCIQYRENGFRERGQTFAFGTSGRCAECGINTNTEKCQNFCQQFYCEKHFYGHFYEKRSIVDDKHSCGAYKTALQRDVLLRLIPKSWQKKFGDPNLCAPDYHYRIASPNGSMTEFYDSQDVWFLEELRALRETKAIRDFLNAHPESGGLDIDTLLQCLRQAGYLGVLYRALLESKEAKKVCCEVLSVALRNLHSQYAEAKQQYSPAEPTKQMPTTESWESRQKSWPNKIVKLVVPLSKAATNYSPVCGIDLSGGPDFFQLATALIDIRKQVNSKHAKDGRRIWHLTVLDFKGFQIFAVNHKTADGKGTTRIVWPLTDSEALCAEDRHPFKKFQLRVLDAPYGVLYRILVEASRILGGDRKLGKAIMDVLSNRDIDDMRSRKMRLGDQHCAFLRGVCFRDSKLVVDETWWLTRTSRSSYDLNGLREVSLYEALCNVLVVQLAAEFRHARAMYYATCEQYLMMERGELSLAQIFGTAQGAIVHGRLAPGANVLTKPLAGQPMEIRLKAESLHEKVRERIKETISGPEVVVRCDRKVLAMPLADSAYYMEQEGASIGCKHLSDASLEDSADPMYQPLMKVLFTVCLQLFGALGSAPDAPHFPPAAEVGVGEDYREWEREAQDADLVGEDDRL